MKVLFGLTCVAVATVAVIAVKDRTKPPTPTGMVVKAVTTEGIRAQRLDADSFDRRWSLVSQMPPTTVVVVRVPAGVEEAKASAVDQAAPERRRILTQTTSLKRADVCARHGMRRVEYSKRGWRYWRCRR
jgi:hypothetical protein